MIFVDLGTLQSSSSFALSSCTGRGYCFELQWLHPKCRRKRKLCSFSLSQKQTLRKEFECKRYIWEVQKIITRERKGDTGKGRKPSNSADSVLGVSPAEGNVSLIT